MASVDGMTPTQIRKEVSNAARNEFEIIRAGVVAEVKAEVKSDMDDAAEYAAIASTAAALVVDGYPNIFPA